VLQSIKQKVSIDTCGERERERENCIHGGNIERTVVCALTCEERPMLIEFLSLVSRHQIHCIVRVELNDQTFLH